MAKTISNIKVPGFSPARIRASLYTMKLIDLHTHKISNEGDIQILNVFAQDLSQDEPKYFFSAGLHPWHIGKVNPEECFQAIERATEQKNMLAIGECGFDRSIPTGFTIQERCFTEQIRIAGKYSKPLIIHCVRAYSDLLKLKKITTSNVPWIIHGYRENQETTLNLIKHGFYFSVGEQFLKDESKHQLFRNMPTERLFFETDDRKISISEVYMLAKQILNIEEEMLIETIFSNFISIFGDDKLALNNYLT